MPEEFQTLLLWVQACLLFAAVCSTVSFLIYSFSGWYKNPMGRVIWAQALGLALAVDLTLLFQFWVPENLWFLFVVNLIGFTLIAASSLALAILLIKMHRNRNRKKDTNERVRQLRPSSLRD